MNRYFNLSNDERHGQPVFVTEPAPWDDWWYIEFEDGHTACVAGHTLSKEPPTEPRRCPHCRQILENPDEN
jgi:hypothetical protein